jgi:hypothetical protein
MTETLRGRVLLGIGCLLAFAGAAAAQETPVWADVDCAQSLLVAPSGLKCRSTQIYSGSASQISGAGGKGQRRQWASFGIVNGSKIYVHCLDEVAAASSAEAGPLDQSIRSISPYAKRADNFSEQKSLNDANYETFTSEAGESCVAARKFGPARKRGFKWIVHASKCAPVGKQLSEGEIGQFVGQIGFRD